MRHFIFKNSIWLIGLFITLTLTNGYAARPSQTTPFSFESVKKQAKLLAQQPYTPPTQDLPAALANLNYDQYQQIQWRPDHAIGAKEKLPFTIEPFHRGYLFKDRVNIYLIINNQAKPFIYLPSDYNFGTTKFINPLPQDIGFAGFRVKYFYPQLKLSSAPYQEIMSFLGASYFRGMGLWQTDGVSARGLAINTGLTEPEEFPVFRTFWIEKPSKQATSLTLYALMDSPSVTGAYQFILRPNTEMEVTSYLYFRRAVERLGIAPMTSMFLTGKNKERFIDDYRPEVHDSDGLLIKRSTGEIVWRPLMNPQQLALTVIKEPTLMGFGLMQRERDFDHYQDIYVNFQDRPNVWVEPLGKWPAGAIYLVEIPSDAERYDNIVAFWKPDVPITPGQSLHFHYRLYFTKNEFLNSSLMKVVATRIGAGGLEKSDHTKRYFAIDFAEPQGNHFKKQSVPQAEVTSSSGKIERIEVAYNGRQHRWRLSFELIPNDRCDPVELRALLKQGNLPLSETWIYQWHPFICNKN